MNKNEKYCLLIEDDPEDQQIFIDALHEVTSNIGCYAVANGEEALFALTRGNLRPDYIFTDLNMPRMNGFEFLKVLRSIEEFKNTPVIIYTSDYSEEQIITAKAFSVTAIYSKTRIGVLKGILRKYFHQSKNEPTVL